jgi:hypothetical protein
MEYAYFPFSGSSGVLSINGDTTPNQLIVGGSGISVGTAGGTTTITATGGTGTVTSVAQTTNSVSGLTVTGSPITTSGTLALTLAQATTSTNGYLSSTDWNTFNGKQAAGSYITALTGDATASGPGSAALTLATVNASPGTFTYATVTVNAKGLVTSASSGSSAFANQTLSNLASPTAVNQSLIPGTTASFGLGTSSSQWEDVNVSRSVNIGTVSATNCPLNIIASTNGSDPLAFTTQILDNNGNYGFLQLFGWTGGTTNQKYMYFQVASNGLQYGKAADNKTSQTSLLLLDWNGNFQIKAGALATKGYQRVVLSSSTGSNQANDNCPGLVLAATGAVTTYALTLPANPLDGQRFFFTTNNTIATLTVLPNGVQVLYGPSTFTSFNTGLEWEFVVADDAWYPLN